MHAHLHIGRILSQLTILSGHHVAITLRFVVVLRNFVGTQLRGDHVAIKRGSDGTICVAT